MIEIVGLGEGGFADLPEPARRLILEARVVLGGIRHLALMPPVNDQVRASWPRPLRAELRHFLDSHRVSDGGVVVVASGDPLNSGIATTLIALLGAQAVRVHPAVSSASLARARMGWSAQTTTEISVVGRSLSPIRRHLSPDGHLVILCSDGSTPAAIAQLVREEGCGESVMTARWHLGGPLEGARTARATDWDPTPTPDLVVVCVDVDPVGVAARVGLGPAPGRPESAFDHDGQITKRDLRACALARLRPTPGAHLWDLGAGSGAVGIEWALATQGARVTAVERDPARADRIRRNAQALGVAPDVKVILADLGADLALADLDPPDAVFVGGGLQLNLLGQLWSKLTPAGRIVAHAVTLGTEATLVNAHARYGGELVRISIDHARPLGRHLSWTPARPVVQWSAIKPSGADSVEGADHSSLEAQ